MKYEVTYRDYDIFLIRTFRGVITMDDILSTWEHIFTKNLITEKHRGVITDYRNCIPEVDIEDTREFENFFKLNFKNFKGLKIAAVIDSPKIAIAMILKNNIPNIKLESFSTMRGAKNWI